ATDAGLCVAGDRRRPPPTSTGRVAPLPHLLPYLAQRATHIRHVVVGADRTGADILVVGPEGAQRAQSVDGHVQYPVHRTATADWSERHFQLRVENTWQSNAQDVAVAVSRSVAEARVRLVVIAGDVRARHLIADALEMSPDVT